MGRGLIKNAPENGQCPAPPLEDETFIAARQLRAIGGETVRKPVIRKLIRDTGLSAERPNHQATDTPTLVRPCRGRSRRSPSSTTARSSARPRPMLPAMELHHQNAQARRPRLYRQGRARRRGQRLQAAPSRRSSTPRPRQRPTISLDQRIRYRGFVGPIGSPAIPRRRSPATPKPVRAIIRPRRRHRSWHRQGQCRRQMDADHAALCRRRPQAHCDRPSTRRAMSACVSLTRTITIDTSSAGGAIDARSRCLLQLRPVERRRHY